MRWRFSRRNEVARPFAWEGPKAGRSGPPSLVLQPRIPTRPAPFWCQIEQIPEWPDDVDVPCILTLRRTEEQQLRAPRMVNASAAPDEYVEHWPLRPIRCFAMIIAVVARAG